ncbi:hypothetical protein K4L44_16430 [Halosquirtibacter laminarini]|uniref:Uncharacterized protein n=1 Tax=Halosquirtibacter laminarini TaxID=3374600 RepID=A0AC61NR13_9BACT|nr:hypothetical protein K4L44_16430 [Prolixibacteraceae bacterium]
MNITDFRITDYLETLQKIAEGERVEISQPYGLVRESHYYYSNLFPHAIGNIASSRTAIKEIRKYRRLAPHLILPQRVVTIHHSAFKSKLSSSSFQVFLSETDDEESYSIPVEKLEGYDQFHFDAFPYATLSTEYRLDWSRMIILMIRQLQELGAVVSVEKEDKKSLKEAYAKEIGERLFVDKCEVPSPLYIQLKEATVFVLPCRNKKVEIRVVGSIAPYEREILESLSPKIFTSRHLDNLSIIENKTKVFDQMIFGESFPLDNLFEWTKGLKNECLKLHEIVPSLRDTIAICDRKYDMYKEVNSSRSLMKNYYYRYGDETDEIAEIIYQNIHRLDRTDPTLAWEKAEKIFQEQNEFLGGN